MAVARVGSRRNANGLSIFLELDWILMIATAILVCSGLLAVYSSVSGGPTPELFKKQLILTAVGIVPFVLFWRIPAVAFQRAAAVLYALNVLLLSFVLFAGHNAKGAQRWVEFGGFQFQPSELTKILTVITLAAFFHRRRDRMKEFSTFALSFLHVAPILFLIFKQPHLGATIVVFISWFTLCLIAGIPWRTLGIFVVVCATLVGGTLLVGKSGWLHGYQADRISAMFSNDEQGDDYQVLRAEMAYGAGGVMGQGFLKGEIKRYVPEQQNDFIFSVVGEEGGLVVCGMVLFAYAVLFSRIWLILIRTGDLFGRLCAAGVLAVLSFHTLINLAMNLQLAPVVGLWLPFMSYGGTAMWLCLGCVGLAQNVYRQDAESVFN
ncbi:MAG: rod shape-determining protein RodA [Chthonomonas sp.]|nr:rod shape-determining protein RodA [Chthonomonas sp.]